MKGRLAILLALTALLVACRLPAPTPASAPSLPSPLLWSQRVDRADQVSLSAAGDLLVVGGGRQVYLFATSSSQPLWSYRAEGAVQQAHISADGNYVVAGADPGAVYLFSRSAAAPLWSYRTEGRVWRVALCREAEHILASDSRGKLYFFSRSRPEPLWSYRSATSGTPNMPVAVSREGSYRAAGNDAPFPQAGIFLFSAESSLPLWSYGPEEWVDWVSSLAFSSQGEYLAAGDYAGRVSLFARSGVLLWSYQTGSDVYSLALSADGEIVAAGGWGGGVQILSRSGALLGSYPTGAPVYSVAVSADGRYVAAGSQDGHIYLLSREGYPLWSYRTGGAVLSVSLSADGSYLAAGSADRQVYLLRTTAIARGRTSLTVVPEAVRTRPGGSLRLVATLDGGGQPLPASWVTWSASQGSFEGQGGLTSADGRDEVIYRAPAVGEATPVTIAAFFAGDESWEGSRGGVTLLIAPDRARPRRLPIAILGDKDFTPENGVTSGKGTPQDPYVIEGWELSATDRPGIHIANTTAPFVVRDVLIVGNGSQDNRWDGLRLEKVSNGRVEASTIERVSRWGIVVKDSAWVVLSGNSIAANARQGIQVFNSQDLVIDGNYLRGNDEIGIQLDEVTRARVSGNTVEGHSKHGIAIYHTSQAVIENNLARSNAWFGIAVHYGSSKNRVRGNRVYGNGLGPWGGGGISVKERSRGNIVESNEVSVNYGQGMALLLGADDSVVRENQVKGNSGIGIYIQGSDGVLVEKNAVLESGQEAIKVEDSAGTRLVENTTR